MKFSGLAILAAAAAILLTACGGSSTDSAVGEDAVTAAPGLTLSGTAATGLALADSDVEVKCATGTGSALTDGSGTYTLTLADGTLPCMLRVTAEVDGMTVMLHSVADTGTTSGDSTTAVANLTPLTEMIVAQATGLPPSELFDSFEDNYGQITSAKLETATTRLADALHDVAGLDLSTIDPFKDTLQAAIASAPDQGDDHDKLLDALMENLQAAALPTVVNQLLTAKAAGDTGPLTLADVMKDVSLGNLPGCPQVLSGKYRFVENLGASWVREFDFKNMKTTLAAGGTIDITPDPEESCKFSVAYSVSSPREFVFGSAGVGAWRTGTAPADSNIGIGFIFPVQAHPLSVLEGEWALVSSGKADDHARSSLEKMTLDSAGAVSAECLYDPSTSECEPIEYDEGDDTGFVEAENGTFGLANSDLLWRIYPYKASNGTLVLFGASDPDRTLETTRRQILVAGKVKPLSLPQPGQATRYWDIDIVKDPLSYESYTSSGPTARATSVTAVDAAAGTFTRERESDGRIDTLEINQPITGLRYRAPSTWNHPTEGTLTLPPIFQLPLDDLGMFITASADPESYSFAISVLRP